MRKSAVHSLCLFALFIVAGVTELASAKSSIRESSETDPVASNPYKVIRPLLLETVRIPVLLPPPKMIRKQIDIVFQTYHIRVMRTDHYHLDFFWVPRCSGSSVCSAGSLVAKAASGRKFSDLKASIERSRYEVVSIQNDLKALIEKPHFTGVGSSMFRKIIFLWGGARYELTLILRDDDEYIKFVQGMIAQK